MNKTTLFVISHMFPYDPPMEQYLYTEIDTIKNYFDKIYIIPSARSVNKDFVNIVDKKIKIINLQRSSWLSEFLKGFFYGLIFNKLFYKDLYKLLINKLAYNKTAISTLLLVYTYSFQLSDKISKEIENLRLNYSDDIVIYSYWLSHYAVIAANIKKKLRDLGYSNVKCVSRAHGSSDVFVSQKMKDVKVGLNTINRNIDRIYSVSEQGTKYLKKIGVNKDIIKTQRLGVLDLKCFHKNKVRSKTFNIVSCSNVVNVKRVHMILKSLRLIYDFNVRWTHFGDGILFNDLKKQSEAKQKNLEIVLFGNKSNEYIMEYYKKDAPDLFINVSLVEGVPVSIMEVASFGIPIIATNVGGTKEVCINNFNGILLDKDFEIAELSKIISRFYYMSENGYNKFRLNSYLLFQEKFNAYNNYIAFANDIKVLIEENKSVE